MRGDVPVLLVEDDDVDVMNVQRAFAKNKIASPLSVASNGEEALEYLHHEGKYLESEDSYRPGLILLDLNMPKMNGIEFLQVVKKDEEFKSIPVVILTTSKEELDRQNGFAYGIAGYIIKPIDFNKFVEAIKLVDLYWSLSETP